jgi:hypothetical protein
MGSASADHVKQETVKVSVKATPDLGDTRHVPLHGGTDMRHEYNDLQLTCSTDTHCRVTV